MSNILLAVDDSDHAKVASEWAILRLRDSSSLHIVSVLPPETALLPAEPAEKGKNPR